MPHHQAGEENITPEQLKLRRLKSLLQRIHDATGVAINEIENVEQVKSQRWKCSNCGERHQFSRASAVVACGNCSQCGRQSWVAVESW
jgi:hypothetical protein